MMQGVLYRNADDLDQVKFVGEAKVDARVAIRRKTIQVESPPLMTHQVCQLRRWCGKFALTTCSPAYIPHLR